MDKNRDIPLGESSDSTLIVRFPGEVKILEMGGAETYKCNVVFGNEMKIPERYEKCASGNQWCKIYDDENAMIIVRGENIDIYRVGENGLLIHSYGSWDGWYDAYVDVFPCENEGE